jgi:hypothetical protein
MPQQTALPNASAPPRQPRGGGLACAYRRTHSMDGRGRSDAPPKLLGEKRRAWDVRALDAAVDHLPIDGDDAGIDKTWGDVDAA